MCADIHGLCFEILFCTKPIGNISRVNVYKSYCKEIQGTTNSTNYMTLLIKFATLLKVAHAR